VTCDIDAAEIGIIQGSVEGVMAEGEREGRCNNITGQVVEAGFKKPLQ
jgi:hypothetical protein